MSWFVTPGSSNFAIFFGLNDNTTTCTVSPDSLDTFQGSSKHGCLCLQMILFEFLKEASIG